MRLGKMGKMRFAARTLGSTRYGGFYVLPEAKIAQNTRISGQVVHETGFFVYYLSTADLCKETDRKIREDLKKPSIYALTHEEKLKIAKYLKERFYAGTSQLNRCLSLHL